MWMLIRVQHTHFKRKFHSLVFVSHIIYHFSITTKTSLREGVDKAIKEICCFAATFPISKENALYTKWNLVITYAKYKYPHFYSGKRL